MPTYECDYRLPAGSREEKRKNLISYLLEEVAGTGKGDRASRYLYRVEIYGEYGIFLKRPTRLNKGFDFTVNIEGVYFKKMKKYTSPSHQDIFDALSDCKERYSEEYQKVKTALISIFECREIDLSNIKAYFRDYEGIEHPIQIILLATKWLFMEQDCAYWNYSGRTMLFEGLMEAGLI